MTNQRNLRQLLTISFSKDELKNLAFDLGIDHENLPDLKEGLARELVIQCERLGILETLLAECRQRRPNETWPEYVRTQSLAELLGEAGPRRPFEPETVAVPAGAFLMGSPTGTGVPDDEQPQHTVELDYFRIGRYPITNREYAAFIKAQPEWPAPVKVGWFLREPPADLLDHPVVGVTWYDALAYCRWLSEETGKNYRLPSEAEWEKAARGLEGLLYPWGNEWLDGYCNAGSDHLTPVDAYPAGVSPYGCYDLLGNVQEWTTTLWGDDRQRPGYAYPYQTTDGRENLADDPHRPRLRRIHRGGSFKDAPAALRCAARDHDRPTSANMARGFRIVLTPR